MFVVVAIVISFGATIVQDLQQEVGNTDTANTTRAGLDALNSFADWLPLLAMIVVIAIILGGIVRFMAFGIEDEDEDNEEESNDYEYDNYECGIHNRTHNKEINEKYKPTTKKKSKEKYPFHKEGICVLTGLTIDDDEDCNVCNK